MLTTPGRKAFERVRNQIGFCGIWCGSCAVGNGCLVGLSTGLRELLEAYGAPGWASVETGWEGFLKDLGTIGRTVSCIGCRSGGGRDDCEIRACALEREISFCPVLPEYSVRSVCQGSCPVTPLARIS